MKDINTVIEEIASKQGLTYIMARYAHEHNYITLNQFQELRENLTTEKSLEVIQYFLDKFEAEFAEEKPFVMDSPDTSNVYPAYILGGNKK